MILQEKVSNELIKKLNKKSWYRHGIYRTSLLWSVEILPGLDKESFQLEGIGKGMENALFTSDGEFFIVQKEFDDFCGLYDVKLKNGISYLKNYIREYNKDMDVCLEECRKIGGEDPSKLSNDDLIKFFLEYFKSIWRLHHWLWSMEFLNESFDRKIHSLMTKVYPTWSKLEVDAFLGNASYTSKRQFFQKEQAEIVLLESSRDLKLKEIFEKYKWFKMNFFVGNPFSFGEYIKRVDEFLENRKDIVDQIQRNKKNVKNAKKLVDTVKDVELREYLLLMKNLSYLKTYRIDVYTISASYVVNLRNEITNRLGISDEQFKLHTISEIVSALNGKSISSKELKSREKYCVVKIDGNYHYFKGDVALQSARNSIWDENEKVESLSGTIAYQGVVRGRVKVSFSSMDTNKIEQGDILVCNLTNPDYNHIFPKLAGIITDEGGVLCHSAIMAREFKIPCIIGTKIATQVLKDGDLVEVDADIGVVSILKGNKNV